MAIVQSGTPATPAATTASPVTGTWGTGQNRAAGNLLVALVVAGGTTSAAATAQNAGTTGWTKIFESANTLRRAAIWTKPATGADAAPAFTSTISGTAQMSCTLIELTDNVNAGRLPVLDTGNSGTGTSGTLTTTTAAAVAAAGEYAVAVDTAGGSTSAANTWGTSGSWTNSFNDGVTANGHWVVAVQASPASGSTLAYAPTHTITSTQQGSATAVFKPGGLYSLVQAGAVTSATSGTTVTPSCAATAAGNLLVLPVTSISSAGAHTMTLPAGWLFTVAETDGNQQRAEIWYYPNCPAGITSVLVTSSGTVQALSGQIQEYHDVNGTNPAPFDVSGVKFAAPPLAIATSAVTTAADELAVAASFTNFGSSTNSTITAGTGFTQAGNYGNGVSQATHSAFDYNPGTGAAGVTVTDTQTITGSPPGSIGVIATFAHAAGAPAGLLPQQVKHRAPAYFTRINAPSRSTVYSR